MDRFQAMRVFTAVLDEGGFAAAGRRLELSAPAVTKQIQSLEQHLGVQLLVRSTRQLHPTAQGRLFYEHCQRVLDAVASAENAVRRREGPLQGQLRMNAPMTFGVRYLSPLLADFLRDHPGLRVELSLADRFVDLIAEGFDLALRIAEPDYQTSLELTPLAPARRVLCASPPYLQAAGEPRHPRELREHRCLHYGYQQSGQRWHLGEGSDAVSVLVNCVFWSNNGDALRQLALADQGIALLPTFIVGADLQNGALRRVLPDWPISALAIMLAHPRHRFLQPAVTALVSYLQGAVPAVPPWDLVD